MEIHQQLCSRKFPSLNHRLDPVSMCYCLFLKAERFHNLWVSSSGVLSKDLRKYQAQIRRGDCTKGLERIGRLVTSGFFLKELIVTYMVVFAWRSDHHCERTL